MQIFQSGEELGEKVKLCRDLNYSPKCTPIAAEILRIAAAEGMTSAELEAACRGAVAAMKRGLAMSPEATQAALDKALDIIEENSFTNLDD